MSSEITIRELRPEDVETVVEIAVAAWEPIYSGCREMLGDDLYSCVFPDWRAEKARQVRNGCQPGSSVQVLVAEWRAEW